MRRQRVEREQEAGLVRATEGPAKAPPGLGNQLVQRLLRAGAAEPAAARSLHRVISGGGTHVPFNRELQRAFGRHDVGGLVAHEGPQAGEAARAWGARALATGRHLVFGEAPSKHDVAHEAAHAVQQRHLGGTLGGTLTEDCEAHADAVADEVGRGRSAEPLLDAFAATRGAGWRGVAGVAATPSRRPRRGAGRSFAGAPVQLLIDASNDDELVYGTAADALSEHLHLLTKDKALYSSKSKRDANKIATIRQGQAVEVLAAADGGGKVSRSWAKVRVKVDGKPTTGYLNTKEGLEDKPLAHAAAGIVMDPEAGPRPEDVAQNLFGDCYLLAPLMSMARRMPDKIRRGVFQTDPTKPADTHTIRFHKENGYNSGKYVAQDVKVANTVLQTQAAMVKPDGTRVPANSNFGANGGYNWPALIEKAFAAWPGKDRDTLDGGVAGRASAYLTGEAHAITTLGLTAGEQRSLTTEQKQEIILGRKADILAALAAGDRMVSASTKAGPSQEWLDANHGKQDGTGASGEMQVGGIVFKHVYEVVDASEHEIRVRNPWGRYGRVHGEVVKTGVSVLTWDEFLAVFADWTTKKV